MTSQVRGAAHMQFNQHELRSRTMLQCCLLSSGEPMRSWPVFAAIHATECGMGVVGTGGLEPISMRVENHMANREGKGIWEGRSKGPSAGSHGEGHNEAPPRSSREWWIPTEH